MTNVFDVTAFGAVPDGNTDSTAAFQKAIDEAAEVKGAVIVPPGSYICSTIYLKPSVCLAGYSGWGYREQGGSVIKLKDRTSHCLIDMTGAFGARVRDVELLGNSCAGENVHGIYVKWENQESRLHDDPEREDNAIPIECHIGFREDSVTVENCHIKNFSGDGIHLERIWAFTIKDCMISSNVGNGIYVKGWDGWITDCILHANRGAGIFTDDICAAVTMTGNRIEWNGKGGIDLVNASSLNVTGNYFDRSYGPALKLKGGWYDCNNITMTGNIFNRSGKYRESFEEDKYDNCHVYLDGCYNIAMSGNTFLTGKDDFGESEFGPDYGIVIKRLNSCAIVGNTLFGGSVKEKLFDLGDHTGENCISNNAGILGTGAEDGKMGNGSY